MLLSVFSVSAAVMAAPVPINVAENVADGASSAEKVAIASNSSRIFAAHLRSLVSGGQLKEIRIVAPDQAITRNGLKLDGWFEDGVIFLTTDLVTRFSTVNTEPFHTLDYSKNNPNDLVFLLGFMAARAQNAASRAMELQQIEDRMKQAVAKAPQGERFDATPYVKDILTLQLVHTARAYINGWAALREAAETENGGKFDLPGFTRLMMKSRTFPLLHAAINKGKFDLRSDGRIPLSPANIQAVMLAMNEFPVPGFD